MALKVPLERPSSSVFLMALREDFLMALREDFLMALKEGLCMLKEDFLMALKETLCMCVWCMCVFFGGGGSLMVALKECQHEARKQVL